MTQLNVVPEGLMAASMQVEALAARLVAANVAHAAVMATVLPPGSDIPSVKLSAALIGHGVQHETSAMLGNEELVRGGVGVAESGTSYLMGDLEGAGAFTAATGL